MKNFLYTMGVAGFVVGLAAYHLSTATGSNKEEEQSKSKRKKTKTKNFKAVRKNSELTKIMPYDGLSANELQEIAHEREPKVSALPEVLAHAFPYLEPRALCRLRSLSKGSRNYIDVLLSDKQYLRRCAKRGFEESLRGKYWLLISKCSVKTDLEEIFLEKSSTTEYIDSNKVSKEHHANKMIQIEKDITRTVGEAYNVPRDSKIIPLIKELLIKYDDYDPRVGYVQGMNFLAKKILSKLNENESFNFMRTLMFEYDLRSLFFTDLPRLKLCLFQMESCLQLYIPAIWHKFRKTSLKLDMFASDWFLTLYSYKFPERFSDAVWDMFLIDGWPVLHAIGLSIIIQNKKVLMKSSFEASLRLLKRLSFGDEETKKILSRAEKIKITGDDLDRMHTVFIESRRFLKY